MLLRKTFQLLIKKKIQEQRKIKNELKRILRKLQYFQLKTKIIKMTERKIDTRRKIQLGGLVITAGLDHLFEMNEAILLGALLEQAEKAKHKPDLLDKWQDNAIGFFKERRKLQQNIQ